MREHDVTALTARELECARRKLAASLALAWAGSLARARRSWYTSPPSTPSCPGGRRPPEQVTSPEPRFGDKRQGVHSRVSAATGSAR